MPTCSAADKEVLLLIHEWVATAWADYDLELTEEDEPRNEPSNSENNGRDS